MTTKKTGSINDFVMEWQQDSEGWSGKGLGVSAVIQPTSLGFRLKIRKDEQDYVILCDSLDGARNTAVYYATKKNPSRLGRANKYHAVKTSYNGVLYDSALEARRAQELDLLQVSGEISGLERQVDFKIMINAVKVCSYRADFVYYDRNGLKIVEDVKGMLTQKAALVLKLMEAVHGIVVRLWPERKKKSKRRI